MGYRCEHYCIRGNRDHFIQYLDNEGYDIDYLDAYFNEDMEEIERIESAANSAGYGPLAPCSTIYNFSSQRTHCRKSWHTQAICYSHVFHRV
jgi:hypothetical protein